GREGARAQNSAQGLLYRTRDAGFDFGRIPDLEVMHPHFTDHSRRLIGLFVPSGERSLSGSMVASRASGPLFLRTHWPCPVLRLQQSAQTHSGRRAETRIQGPPEIQIERKIPATGGEITGKKIKR